MPKTKEQLKKEIADKDTFLNKASAIAIDAVSAMTRAYTNKQTNKYGELKGQIESSKRELDSLEDVNSHKWKGMSE